MPNRSDIERLSRAIGMNDEKFLKEWNEKQNIELIITQLTKINKKLDKITENNQSFRRKLESEISKIRESNGDIADTLDQLIRDWNDL